ncbi:YeeE/YedE family protein [Lacticaseibacillus mingshuiensis]|uniref:YeeE/YedE family protein n=1 Tax=Lacticaseibacillus mingshuiensis TaxID=2799574 RepID=A0ABW4CIA7_9LACO|nr:YeeE/YedE family protein [Lacticaseibacillus mingshuiensis]
MKHLDCIAGFVLLAVLLIGGPFALATNMLYIRLLLGLALGYILSRSYTGFAGSVNRAYKTGSTSLMRTMMFMFVITAIANMAFLVLAPDIKAYDLWINPINLGLLLGGLLFGLGMSFSSCCASGVLTDLATDAPRAGVTLIFFCLGVFVGFPVQATASWVKDSWFTSSTGAKFANGVFMPDWFKWDGLNGYLGAIILTIIFAGIVVWLSYRYEKMRRNNKTYVGVPSERVQENAPKQDIAEFAVGSEKNYYALFVKPWTLKQGAIGMMMVFVLLMGLTKSGWGASTPYGFWFGKVLNLVGVSADSLANFTHQAPAVFSNPWLSNPVTVQNFGIFLGAVFFILSSGLFKETMGAIPRLTGKSTVMYIIGGFTMGFGTRLANGCNVGALYSPIAEFSLSGWIFLIVLVLGAIGGNRIAKRVYGY